MVTACKEGLLGFLKYWVVGGWRPRPEMGLKLAEMAALSGHLDIVAWLTDSNFFPMKRNELVLHAVVKDHLEVASYLIEKGCCVSHLAHEVARIRSNIFSPFDEMVKVKNLLLFDELDPDVVSLSRIYAGKVGVMPIHVEPMEMPRLQRHLFPFILEVLVKESAIIFNYQQIELLAKWEQWGIVRAICEGQKLPRRSTIILFPGRNPPVWYRDARNVLRFGLSSQSTGLPDTLYSVFTRMLSKKATHLYVFKQFFERDWIDLTAAQLMVLLESESNWPIIKPILDISNPYQLRLHLADIINCGHDIVFKRIVKETNIMSVFKSDDMKMFAKSNIGSARLHWLIMTEKRIPITEQLAIDLFISLMKDLVLEIVPSIIPRIDLHPRTLFQYPHGVGVASAFIESNPSDRVALYLEMHEKGWAQIAIEHDFPLGVHIGSNASDLVALCQKGGFEWTSAMQQSLVENGRFDILSKIFMDGSLPLDPAVRTFVIDSCISIDPELLWSTPLGEAWTAKDTVLAAEQGRWNYVHFGLMEPEMLTMEDQKNIAAAAVKANILVDCGNAAHVQTFLDDFDFSSFTEPVDNSWYCRDPYNFESLFLAKQRGANVDISHLVRMLIDRSLSGALRPYDSVRYFEKFDFDLSESGWLKFETKTNLFGPQVISDRIPLHGNEAVGFVRLLFIFNLIVFVMLFF